MPRIFTGGGWWAVLVPVVILAALFVGVLRTPSEEGAVEPTPAATVFVPAFEKLPPVPDGHYELWGKRPDGGEERLAAFTVRVGGALFTLTGDALQTVPVSELPPPNATLLLTVEQGAEPAVSRSPRVLLRGTLAETRVDFTAVLSGRLPSDNQALLQAPSDARAPDTTGVWFASSAAGGKAPAAGLKLPTAPAGWVYGGFVTTATSTILRTGAFRDPAQPDDEAPFSGSGKRLSVPGEDFVRNAPEGVRFPLNLADGRSTVVVALLPEFAPNAAEAFLPLLQARIPYRQKTGTPVMLSAVSADELPRGSGRFELQGATVPAE